MAMAMALLAGGGAVTISALGNCVVPRYAVKRLELYRYSGLRSLKCSQPRYNLRSAAPYYGGWSPCKFVCRAAAAAATVESDAHVKTALPAIPSEATLAKVFISLLQGRGILHAEW